VSGSAVVGDETVMLFADGKPVEIPIF